MPHYELFAARDGDTFKDAAVHPDWESAENWAGNRIITAFGLSHLAKCEYDQIVAETDGVFLDILPSDPVGAFLQDWLMAQAQLIDPLMKHFSGKFTPQFRSYQGGILDLILALQRDQQGLPA